MLLVPDGVAALESKLSVRAGKVGCEDGGGDVTIEAECGDDADLGPVSIA